MNETYRDGTPVYDTNCPECGGRMICEWGTFATLLGGPNLDDGHVHDPNCRRREYVCLSCKHMITVHKQNKCPIEDCDWVGDKECFCHEGEKAKEWPTPYKAL